MPYDVWWLVVGLAGGAAAVWFFTRRTAGGGDALTQQVAALQRTIDDRLAEQKLFLSNRVGHTEAAVRSVSAGLGKLEAATAALQRTNQEIVSFQQMLRSPKVRGSFGEVLLGNLLADVLPADRYELQHVFPSGEIADAIIRLQDGYIVAIDAKFPLANFERDDPKAWQRDVKHHIQSIAGKYIAPAHKTLDYAFMYIPLEGVYYQTMVKDTDGAALWDFCLKRRVIPVSPNSFLAYLQTILVGLRGLKIEQQTKEILRSLGQLRQDFVSFSKDYAMIGTHLTNAKNRYDDSARRLDKFSNRLEQVEGGSSTAAALPEQSLE